MWRMQSAWFCQSVLTPCGAKLERGICKWSKEMVDLVGIEPTTSSMPWKRAPSCATGPLSGKYLRCSHINSHPPPPPESNPRTIYFAKPWKIHYSEARNVRIQHPSVPNTNESSPRH